MRPLVPELDALLGHPHPVLDHGYIRVVDYMGNDDAIVQAARVSYGKGTKKVSEDRGLIRYLMRHRHSTPFEMCEIKFHIKLPLFVARQWIRHRTANVNEYSARYSELENEFYIPQRWEEQGVANRQGSSTPLNSEDAAALRDTFLHQSEAAYQAYQDCLRKGLSRELARTLLPVNIYTQWYWKIDLHNLLHFIALRGDDHAQYEIQVYAHVLESLVKAWVPLAYEAFQDYRKGSMHLSRSAANVVKSQLQRKSPPSQKESGLSPREWQELLTTLPLDV